MTVSAAVSLDISCGKRWRWPQFTCCVVCSCRGGGVVYCSAISTLPAGTDLLLVRSNTKHATPSRRRHLTALGDSSGVSRVEKCGSPGPFLLAWSSSMCKKHFPEVCGNAGVAFQRNKYGPTVRLTEFPICKDNGRTFVSPLAPPL